MTLPEVSASKGISLTAHQEYAIEELWHEILHNKSCNTTIYPSIRSLSHDIMIIEAVNQLVARHTYTEFMQELIGISPSHAEWILTSGYAYEQPVTNLRSLLGLLSYEDLFIEEACEELIIGYQNFTDRISDRLAINSGKYNAGESLVAAIDKAGSRMSLTAHEEYAIENLWHEILHNKSCDTTISPSIHGITHETMIIETVNQLVARWTYAEFMQELISIPSSHAGWVLTNGYAYRHQVTNLRSLLDLLSYEPLFIEAACEELMIGYQNFTNRISNILAINCGKYHTGDIIELFRLIDSPNFAPTFAIQAGYEGFLLPCG
jgi:hypothetical protein